MDSRWSCVLDALVGGSFNEVGVVAATFDSSGIGAVTAAGIHLADHIGQCFGERFPLMFRGKSPSALSPAGG
jgi:hypothetical protein